MQKFHSDLIETYMPVCDKALCGIGYVNELKFIE